MPTISATTRTAARLSRLTEQQITNALNDLISRAFLLHGDAHTLALDFNAKLITELRQTPRVWPRRDTHPCDE